MNDNSPHIVDFHDKRATAIAPGVTLFTKDGTNLGNAIVVKSVNPPPPAIEYLLKTNQKLWMVETDFGNRMDLTDNEINELFTLGRPDNYERWFDDRLDLIKKGVRDS